MSRKRLPVVKIASLLLFLSIACGGREPAPGGVKIALLDGGTQSFLLHFGIDINGDYVKALAKQGASVVRISVKDDPAEIDRRLASVSGLLVPGGFDIEPSLYKEAPDKKIVMTDPALDKLEFRAFSYAREKRMPVLGICRGCQALNVFYGGSLYQDIPSQYREKTQVPHTRTVNLLIYRHPVPCFHDISIEKKSELARILKLGSARVNTYHHQAAKRVAPGFLVAARSPDGVVEAIERMEGGVFILGIQFHPEKMLDETPVMNEIFRAFVRRASVWDCSGKRENKH